MAGKSASFALAATHRKQPHFTSLHFTPLFSIMCGGIEQQPSWTPALQEAMRWAHRYDDSSGCDNAHAAFAITYAT
jgi:hypothetical protein